MGQRIMEISEDLFLDWFRGEHQGWRVIRDAIPEDAHVVDVRLDVLSNRYIYVAMESASWPDVKDGELLPRFAPTFQDLRVKANS